MCLERNNLLQDNYAEMVYNVKNIIPVNIAVYISILKIDTSDRSYSVPFCYQVKKVRFRNIKKKKTYKCIS